MSSPPAGPKPPGFEPGSGVSGQAPKRPGFEPGSGISSQPNPNIKTPPPPPPAVVPVPIVPPQPNGPVQKSLVRITATAVEPDYRAPWNVGQLQRGVGA